jgi:hypothetical protein
MRIPDCFDLLPRALLINYGRAVNCYLKASPAWKNEIRQSDCGMTFYLLGLVRADKSQPAMAESPLVIALHSPYAPLETGLRICPPEKS